MDRIATTNTSTQPVVGPPAASVGRSGRPAIDERQTFIPLSQARAEELRAYELEAAARHSGQGWARRLWAVLHSRRA